MTGSVAQILLCICAIGGVEVPDHSRFDRILSDAVRDERVDYTLIATQHRLELFNYLAKMAMVDPALLEPKDQLAYYINLYNATMINEVIQRRVNSPQWTPADNDFAVFKEAMAHTATRKLSLDELEHTVIRPTFKDPRIHSALVCAARSCPPLLNRAYRGEDLDQVLDANMKRFVADRFRNPIDDQNKQLRLSRIFDWYAADFGGPEGVVTYVSRVAGRDYSGYTVSFVDYSWELNDTKAQR
jgi:hypothetical protein